MELDQITERIIGCALRVHTELGPGLLEGVYETCLKHELVKAGMRVRDPGAFAHQLRRHSV